MEQRPKARTKAAHTRIPDPPRRLVQALAWLWERGVIVNLAFSLAGLIGALLIWALTPGVRRLPPPAEVILALAGIGAAWIVKGIVFAVPLLIQGALATAGGMAFKELWGRIARKNRKRDRPK